MASTSRSFESTASSEPSASSSLLRSMNSVSSYTGERNRRAVTPADALIREVWYYTLRSTFHEDWANIRESFDGSLCSKLGAIMKCLWLPFYVLIHALDGRRRYFRQNGIMYLYAYLGVTVVLNLTVALKIGREAMKCTQKVFVILSMAGAIFCMLYLLKKVYRTVTYPASRGTFLRIFYEGGLYVFGFSSFGYSVAIVVDYGLCGHRHTLDAEVTGVKATFTLTQIVFFHCFYRARIPKDTPYIEFILAHLLGTNLALWFWILCSEAAVNPEECIGHVEKYFTPLFVEFLLLGASLFYQIWNDLKSEDTSTLPLMQHRCICNECQSVQYRDLLASNIRDSRSENSSNTRSSPNARSHHPGPIIGGSFAAIFVVLIVFAHLFSDKRYRTRYHIAYSVGTIILHVTQICACYICQLSLQFHQRDPERYQGNPERFVLDHEDTLLYFSLAGIVLWHGFHAQSLLLSHSTPIDLVADTMAILQVLFQTAILVNLRSYQQTEGQSQVWIRECLLFLLVTNLTLWFEESFYIEIPITTPGERYEQIQHDLGTIGYIVHPLSIFYRFHSSVCCVLAWYIFRTE